MSGEQATASKPSASRQAADYLRKHIAAGSWHVGEKIPSENTLARELGVSRVSVRLAIQQFITLGVLESARGKGTFLKTGDLAVLGHGPGGSGIGRNDCRNVAKVIQFRLFLEPEACYLAAEKNDPAVTERLREHLHALVANIGDSERFIEHDIRFHLEIARASDNPLVYRALRDVFRQTQRDHRRINDIFGYKDGVYYHSLIQKAFESNNPRLARKLMAEHMQQALDQLTGRD